MRSIALVLLVALVLIPSPPVGASEPPRLLSDPAGDLSVVASAAGQGVAVPVPAAPTTTEGDLLALDVVESEDDLSFVVTVAGIGGQGFSYGDYIVEFSWRRVDYQVRFYREFIEGVGDYAYAELRVVQDSRPSRVAVLDHVLDVPGGTFTVSLPKVYVVSRDDRVPLVGDALTDFSVRATTSYVRAQGSFSVEDLMPDEGVVEYVIQKGGFATGHLSLASLDPVRVSNGGATTFVFQAILRNSADVEDEVGFEAVGLPEGWTATVPTSQRVAAGSDTPVTVLASVPFAHEHGGFDSFNLTATSRNDPSATATLRLGVLHTPIPQPAGHHPDLFLHGEVSSNFPVLSDLFPWATAYMNTEPPREGEVSEVYADDADVFVDYTVYRWHIPLGPALAMGLDFDVTRTGSFTTAVLGRTYGDGTVSAELLHAKLEGDEFGRVTLGESTLLAEARKVEVTLDPLSPSPAALVLETTPDSDYVPYVKDRNLWLVVTLEAPGASFPILRAQTPALVVEDSRMTLPLDEYHDRLGGAAEAATAVGLTADGPVEKTGRPGDVLTYAFTLTNLGSDVERFVLDVAGTDAKAGEAVPRGAVRLDAGESRKVTLAVRLPAEAADGQTLEVLLFARAESDPSKMAVARTSTVVSAAAEGADESALLEAAEKEGGKRTPVPGAWAVLAIAAAAAGGRHLRRDP